MHTPTPEQQAILDEATSTNTNIMIEALAGAAKTYTLELIAKAITGKPILAIAFNKRIADEMAIRLPSHVLCKTLNSVGHSAWAKFIGKRVTLNADKLYTLLKEEIDNLPKDDMWEAREVFPDTLSALCKAKALGYMPKELYTNVKHLHINEDEFFEDLEVIEGTLLSPMQIDLIKFCINRSIKQAFDGIIDFDDQIYMPTLFGGVFPEFPLTLCDEVQDFSRLNQEMAKKIVGSRRIIAVGDPCQSIYAFRGADSVAMEAMKKIFNMKVMELSTSFRCPIAGVELARRRAPQMQYPAWAKQGKIETLDTWKISDIPAGSFVICRNNAPLFNLALQFLKNGRSVHLVGSQLSRGLIRIMKKFGKESMTQAEAYDALENWKKLQMKKAKTISKQNIITDKEDCLRIFLRAGKTLGESIAYANAVFKADGNVRLMNGHKSKGLENDVVFHLDSQLVAAPWVVERFGEAAMQQELNLQYVIDTRFKERYVYIYTEGLEK